MAKNEGRRQERQNKDGDLQQMFDIPVYSNAYIFKSL